MGGFTITWSGTNWGTGINADPGQGYTGLCGFKLFDINVVVPNSSASAYGIRLVNFIYGHVTNVEVRGPLGLYLGENDPPHPLDNPPYPGGDFGNTVFDNIALDNDSSTNSGSRATNIMEIASTHQGGMTQLTFTRLQLGSWLSDGSNPVYALTMTGAAWCTFTGVDIEFSKVGSYSANAAVQLNGCTNLVFMNLSTNVIVDLEPATFQGTATATTHIRFLGPSFTRMTWSGTSPGPQNIEVFGGTLDTSTGPPGATNAGILQTGHYGGFLGWPQPPGLPSSGNPSYTNTAPFPIRVYIATSGAGTPSTVSSIYIYDTFANYVDWNPTTLQGGFLCELAPGETLTLNGFVKGTQSITWVTYAV